MKKFFKKIFTPPVWPAMLSALGFPGLGQIANGDLLKGLLFFGSSVGSFIYFSSVVTDQISLYMTGTPDQWMKDPDLFRTQLTKMVESNPGMFFTFQILIVFVWLVSIFDAYSSAKKRIAEGKTNLNLE